MIVVSIMRYDRRAVWARLDLKRWDDEELHIPTTSVVCSRFKIPRGGGPHISGSYGCGYPSRGPPASRIQIAAQV